MNKRINWMKTADTLVERGIHSLRAMKLGRCVGECLVAEGGHRVARWLESMEEAGAHVESYPSESWLKKARAAA